MFDNGFDYAPQPWDMNMYPGMDYPQPYFMSMWFMSLSDAFASPDQSMEFWDEKESSATPQKVTAHFDTSDKKISVVSDEVDAYGNPTHVWQLDQITGKIQLTKRSRDGSDVHTSYKYLDQRTGIKQEITGPATDSMKDLQNQKDTVTNLMYVTIFFFIGVLAMVYQFNQKNKTTRQGNQMSKSELRQQTHMATHDDRSKNHREETNFGGNNLEHLSTKETGILDNC